MKKKFLFLLALPTLFAACSSDELSEVGQGGNDTPTKTEEVAVVQNVEFTNGTLMSVGDIDATETRAIEEGKYAKFWLEIPEDVLKGQEYNIVADDFAIRVNGKYQDDLTVLPVEPSSPMYAYWGEDILIKDNRKLGIGVEGLENVTAGTTVDNNPEYTYEVYIWVKNEKEVLKTDGSGLYETSELFGDTMKSKWMGKDDYDKDGNLIPGEDISEQCVGHLQRTAADGGNGYYSVRYNVYRGLQGENLNTPYIKVSIHVRRTDLLTDVEGAKQNHIEAVSPSDTNN